VLRKLSCGPTPEKLQGCWAGPGLLVPGLDGAMGAMVSGGKIGMVMTNIAMEAMAHRNRWFTYYKWWIFPWLC